MHEAAPRKLHLMGLSASNQIDGAQTANRIKSGTAQPSKLMIDKTGHISVDIRLAPMVLRTWAFQPEDKQLLAGHTA